MLGIGLYAQEICCTIDFEADNPDLNVPLWFSLSPLNTCHLDKLLSKTFTPLSKYVKMILSYTYD